MNSPLVSIGIASFNNASYIEETLNSILQQEYKNWELIIVDDCSKDDSVRVIQQWIQEQPGVNARLIKNEVNQGVCRVLNTIIREARGEYISTIGSDDLYTPEKLRAQVATFAHLGPEYGMVYSDAHKIGPSGELLDGGASILATHPKPEGNIFEALLAENFLPAMTQLTRKSVYEELGGFDESLAFEDWDMWLRITRKYLVKYVPISAAKYRIHPKSLTFQRQLQMAEACAELLSRQSGYSPAGDAIIAKQLATYAETTYWLESPRAAYWLTRAWQAKRTRRTLGLMLLAKAGVSLRRLHSIYRRVLPQASSSQTS